MKKGIKEVIAQSPGRINLIGEHTDYNEGFVLPAAIDRKTTVALKRLPSGAACTLRAVNLDETHSFSLNDFSPVKDSWANYLMGVVHELQQLGGQIAPFSCAFEGDVPIGSGMSSSAALECSFAFALNAMFELGFDRFQLMRSAQLAEHHFVGTKCGIMDQFASVMGRKGQAMLLDCRSLDYTYYPLEIGDYQILLLNTMVSHALATSEYNLRREECEKGVSLLQAFYPGIGSLRDLGLDQLEEQQANLPEKIYKRCLHVVGENARVLQASEALKAGDINGLGYLMYQSHDSLSNDYEVSCKELDFLVDLTRDRPFVAGARMMGGGFGGCTINLIDREYVDAFISGATDSYLATFGLEPEAHIVSVDEGTRLVKTA